MFQLLHMSEEAINDGYLVPYHTIETTQVYGKRIQYDELSDEEKEILRKP